MRQPATRRDPHIPAIELVHNVVAVHLIQIENKDMNLVTEPPDNTLFLEPDEADRRTLCSATNVALAT